MEISQNSHSISHISQNQTNNNFGQSILHKNDKYQQQQQIQNTIVGQLESFISPSQLKWRKRQVFQQYPYQAFSQYLRNVQYKSENLRSPKTLTKAIDYLLQNIIGLGQLYQNRNDSRFEKKKVFQYLENRLRAIRCQFYVQNYFELQVFQKLILIGIIILPYSLQSGQLITVLGIMFQKYIKYHSTTSKRQLIISQHDQGTNKIIKYLKYLMFVSIKFQRYQSLLPIIPEKVFASPQIQTTLNLCNIIQSKKFTHKYFSYLISDQCSYLDACILILYLQQMRQFMLISFSKAQINLKISFLTQFLFFDNKLKCMKWLQGFGYNLKEHIQTLVKDKQKDQDFFIQLKISNKDIKQNWNSTANVFNFCEKRLNQKKKQKKYVDIIKNQI